ncbi:MAG: lamin tail domain-containing protein, partial [candidate division WOR-3 bacterium]
SPIRLKPMYLTDNLSRPMKWTFPDTTIPAHGYLLIWADGEYRQGPLHASFRLSASQGEELGLFTSRGDRVFIVDTMRFGPQRADTSYGRIPDGGNWQLLSVPTPGEPNTSAVSSLAGTVFINEFLASNQTINTDEAGDYDDWVELYNAADTAVTLRGWTLPDVTIPARGYQLIWADGEAEEGQFHASFNLAAAQGEQLGLFEKHGTHALMVDTLSFGPQKPDTSMGRLPDGGPDWQFLLPTPARANRTRK